MLRMPTVLLLMPSLLLLACSDSPVSPVPNSDHPLTYTGPIENDALVDSLVGHWMAPIVCQYEDLYFDSGGTLTWVHTAGFVGTLTTSRFQYSIDGAMIALRPHAAPDSVEYFGVQFHDEEWSLEFVPLIEYPDMQPVLMAFRWRKMGS